MTSEKWIERGGAKLFTEALGDQSDSPILLIMGVMASKLWWPETFCAGLVHAGFFVIRYDNRDTGLSTHCPQGQPNYSFADMADDAVAILDGYGIDKAHIVGMSMGGMLAQQVALRYPNRVRSASFISTSPVGMKDLPPSTEAYRAHSAEGETVDWTDLAAMAAYIRKDCAMIASTKHPHDGAAIADLIARDMKRSHDFRSVTNHFMLLGDDGSELKAADIEVPTLVIHGTSDPLFPVEHGEAFASIVPGARLVRINGGGHEIHPQDSDEIVAAIAEHVGRH
ncbi:MAG: alpha/beta fold hydrolase [Rhizobiaceae bacterium]